MLDADLGWCVRVVVSGRRWAGTGCLAGALLVGSLLVGCGGDGEGTDGSDSDGSDSDGAGDDSSGAPNTDTLEGLSCAIPLTLTGTEDGEEVVIEVPREDLGCLYPSNGDTGASMTFFAGGEISTLTLDIADVAPDELGDFPATLTVNFGNGHTYVADCTVTVASQVAGTADQFGRRYELRGNGGCSSPATDDETGETFEVANFAFVGGTLWPPVE